MHIIFCKFYIHEVSLAPDNADESYLQDNQSFINKHEYAFLFLTFGVYIKLICSILVSFVFSHYSTRKHIHINRFSLFLQIAI